MNARRMSPVFVLSIGAICCGCASMPRADFGPVMSRTGTGLTALGPFIESRDLPQQGHEIAVRPIFCRGSAVNPDRSWLEILWPVFSHKTFRNETHWRFLSVLGHDFDNTDSRSRWRILGYPLFCLGRAANGERYFAVFPCGGKVNEFLGMDRIVFAFFPLYVESRIKDITTRSILWPLISWSRGPDVHRFRVFPLYGKSTNRGRWTKRFVLWPFWNSTEYEYPDAKGRAFLLFPLFGRARIGAQSAWWILPPFFKWADNNGERIVHCPWPFIRYSSGSVNKLYIWPLWGSRRSGKPGAEARSGFFLWPLGWMYKADRGTGKLRRFVFMPFFHHESLSARVPDKDGVKREETVSRSFKFWPVFSYRRDDKGKRLNALSLWPMKDGGPVGRSWAPFWTVYSGRWDMQHSQHEILWGLVRFGRSGIGQGYFSAFPLLSVGNPEGKKRDVEWSVLKGIIGYSRKEGRKTLRILYIPIRLSAGSVKNSMKSMKTTDGRQSD